MVCNSCQQKAQNQNTLNQQINPSIDILQLQNMSTEQKLDLYRQGYRIPTNPYNIGVQSLAVKDIGTGQMIVFGLFSYGAYASYKSGHNIIAIVLGALGLGSAIDIYQNYKK